MECLRLRFKAESSRLEGRRRYGRAWAQHPGLSGLESVSEPDSVFTGQAAPCRLILAWTLISIPFSAAQLCTMNPPRWPDPGPSCTLPGWSPARTLMLTAEQVGQAGEGGGQGGSPSCCAYDTAIV